MALDSKLSQLPPIGTYPVPDSHIFELAFPGVGNYQAYFNSAVRASRLDQMAAPASTVSFNGQAITNLASITPVSTLNVLGQIKAASASTQLILSNSSGTSQASMHFRREGAATDQKLWEIVHYDDLANGNLAIRAVNDAYSVGAGAIEIGRLSSGFGIDFIALSTNGSEALRVNSIRNVGIGTSTPSQLLHVSKTQAAGATIIKVENASTGVGSIAGFEMATGSANTYASLGVTDSSTPYSEWAIGSGVTGGMYITARNSSAPIILRQSSSERMRIDSAGNVGIGTSSPATKLEVKGAGFTAISISNDSTNESQLRFNTNTAARITNQANTALIFDTNGLERGRFDNVGNFGVGTNNFGTSAVRVIGIANGTAPTTSPAGMGQFWVENGALKYRGSSGTVTTLAPA